VSSLELRSLTVRFGTGRRTLTAVDQVDLRIPDGQVLGLVGESGSGKSTLARAIVGLVPASAGQVLLDGRPLGPARRDGARRRSVQMVFQDPYSSLDPRMRVGEAIIEGLRAGQGASRDGRAAEVERLLGLVGLEPGHAAVLPRYLSGGQRQRVALARALAARPSVLIADEITSALDVSVQGMVLNLIRDLQRRLGLSMLFISHNLAVVRYLADTIAVMYCGQVVEVAPAGPLAERPRHPYTRTLLASVPSLRGGAGAPETAGDGQQPDAEPADPHHPPAGCRFHPRCPVGPANHAGREICREADPASAAAGRPHRAACFFATG
jgi:peptide/nickel transport system ATP-binding protein